MNAFYSDADVLSMSETCFLCLDGNPIAVASIDEHGRVPVCSKCCDALREAGPSEEVA